MPGTQPGRGLPLSCRPNPSRSQVTISLSLPRAGDVSMKIYNTTGQLVRSIPPVSSPAGFATVRWDGRDDAGRVAAGGVYLCRVSAAGYTGTLKAMLVK
jgi:flagellar hook assembly protein FlgD